MKGYTDLEQSKKLAEFLPIESADMFYDAGNETQPTFRLRSYGHIMFNNDVCAWSFAALLKYLSEFKPQVYTPVLFSSEGKWILQFVEYGHGNVCEVSCDNPIDACVAMIEKLHKLNLL